MSRAPFDLAHRRRRAGITLGVWVLMGLHTALVARGHARSGMGNLVLLGAYSGGLAAFVAGIASAAAFLRGGGAPGMGLSAMVGVAWRGAAGGAVVGGVCAALLRALVPGQGHAGWAAMLGACLVTPVAAVQAARRLAQRASHAQPGSGAVASAARARLVMVGWAMLASGTWGALHPFVRFPEGAPSDSRGRWAYALAGLAVTVLLLPLAGTRLGRALRASGAVAGPPAANAAGYGVAWLVAAAACALWVALAPPATVAAWAVWRLCCGAVVGGVGAAWALGRA